MLDWSEVNEFRGIYKGIGRVCCVSGGQFGSGTPPEPTPADIEVYRVASERQVKIDDTISHLENERQMISGSISEEQSKYFDNWIDWLKQYKPITHRDAGNYGGGMPMVTPQWQPARASPSFDAEFSQWKTYADRVVQEAEDLKPIIAPPKVSSVKVDQTSTMYKSQYGQVPMATKKTVQRGSTPYYQSEKKTPKGSQSQSLYTRMKTGKL
jgi:hypothetical protein